MACAGIAALFEGMGAAGVMEGADAYLMGGTAALGAGEGVGAAWGAGTSAAGALEGADAYALGGTSATGGADFGAGYAGLSAAEMAELGGLGASTTELSTGLGSMSGASTGWGDMTGMLKMAGPAMSMASGLYGMTLADQQRKLAMLAAQKADPWGQSGGRALAGGQLQDLLQNPGNVTKLPGYQAGLEAVQRSMQAQGYQGSGNMMAGLSKYGGDFYNNAISQLSGLAGANQNPAAGQQLMLGGTQNANSLASSSLASMGYGMTQATGGSTQMPPQLMAQLQAYFKQQGMV